MSANQQMMMVGGALFPGNPAAVYIPAVHSSMLNGAGFEPAYNDDVASINDLSGNGRHLTQADINKRMICLKWEGKNYLHLRSTSPYADAYISYIAAMNLNGFVYQQEMSMDTVWASGANKMIATRYIQSGSQFSWNFYVNATGNLAFDWYVPGLNQVVSTAATGFAAYAIRHVRMEYIPNTGAGQYSVTFWTSVDGASWTQLGSVLTGATTAAISTTTARLALGTIDGISSICLRGRIYSCKLSSGTVLSPTTVIEWSANSASHFQQSGIPCIVGATTAVVSNRAAIIGKTTLATHGGINKAYDVANPTTIAEDSVSAYSTLGYFSSSLSGVCCPVGTSKTTGLASPYGAMLYGAVQIFWGVPSRYFNLNATTNSVKNRVIARAVAGVGSITINGVTSAPTATTVGADTAQYDKAFIRGTDVCNTDIYIDKWALWNTVLPTNTEINTWLQ